MTSIGAGLQVGQNQLNAYGSEKSEKAIILMSDGWENTPPMVANILPGIISDKIKVCTVGLGFNSDMGLLNNIAQQTGCAYKFAATAEALQEIYQDLWSEISGEDTVKKIKETIKPMETITKFAYLDSSMHSATFSLSWPGSNIDLTLIDPNGNEINHNTNDPNVEFVEGDTYEFYRIDNPTNGEWQLNFYGQDIPVGGEDFVFTLSGINGLILEAELDKAEYFQGERIKITAFVQDPIMDVDDPQYVSEASFDIRAIYPDQSISSFQLFDDGNHEDGGASDGVYANIFNGAQTSGSYAFTIKAEGATNRSGDLFTREKTISTVVKKSEKKNVIITVPDKQGFAFDDIVIEAEIKDEFGEVLIGDSNEINFKINDEIIGSAIIDNSGKAQINWTIDLIPTNLTETYSIAAAFSGNELYFPAEGKGEFVFLSSKQLKQDALAKLEAMQSNNEQVQKEINKAIKNTEESLSQELWIDASRLDEQHGHKVFDNEKQAIKGLLKIIEEKGKHQDLGIAKSYRYCS